MGAIADSTYLDFAGWHTTTDTTVAAAYGYEPGYAFRPASSVTMNVAIVLNRENDPTALLAMDWGDRQKALADLNASGTLWSTYGADATTYHDMTQALTAEGIKILGAADGYVSSAESRTIWVQLNSAQFEHVFGTPLLGLGGGFAAPDVLFWNGSLSVRDDWNSAIAGLWPDYFTVPYTDTFAGGSTTLPQGAQSPGNAAGATSNFPPQQIAELYNFPLTDGTTVTGNLALIEPVIGAALPPGTKESFQQLLDLYRSRIGIDSSGHYYVVAGAGDKWVEIRGLERSLDIGVATAVNAGANVGLYVGPGLVDQSTFPAWQSAIWDLTNAPGVISSSFDDANSSAPNSPFLIAYRELWVDAALRNITMYNAAGDGGSGNAVGNGLTNVIQGITSPYGVLVGGTSLNTPGAAASDPTLADMIASAQAGDLTTLQMLVAGGLKTLPSQAPAFSAFVETVWNNYFLSGRSLNPSYVNNNAGLGGVDGTQATPGYQTAYGLTPTSVGAQPHTGRGVPDVSAVSGGNMYYDAPSANMQALWTNDFGTSAATPLWASLSLQIQTIFEDQGLPRPGYLNDLLYTAAVIAPAAFNDITLGNNIATFTYGGPINAQGTDITPTGHGYAAGPGYDLATGLGSPNGLLLARAMTAIAHGQMYFDTPEVLVSGAGSALTAGVTETLLLQPMLTGAATVQLDIDGVQHTMASAAGAAHAWTSQFAQQVLQSDFSSQLVTLFDAQSQSAAHETHIAAGDSLQVSLNGAATATPQVTLSAPYGFVDFVSADGTQAVQVARAVAVAETAEGARDQDAVVRLRQVGTSDVDVMFYKADDYAGTVGGLAPGQAGYDAAALGHAYRTTAGATWIDGPGFGAYGQSEIAHVNAGDLIAMALTANGHTFYAFAGANADGVNHLWSYGLNTFGWEDLYGGGDLDYNDLVVQLDFTSAAGHGYLV